MTTGGLSIKIFGLQKQSLRSNDGKFTLKRKLGKGSEGSVYEAIHNGSHRSVAIKIVHSLQCANKRSAVLLHPGIVKTLNVRHNGRTIYQLMEKFDGDLLAKISSSQDFHLSENQSKKIFVQITHALFACHQNDIYHGDVKPENIFIKGNQAKIGDFYYDLDIVKERHRHTNIDTFGSQQYLAPELLHFPDQNSIFCPVSLAAADVWALGLTLFVMAAGYKPWESASDQDPHYSRFLEDPEEVWPVWFSESLRNLLGGMLNHDADRRLSLLQVWEHPWISTLVGPNDIRPLFHELYIEYQDEDDTDIEKGLNEFILSKVSNEVNFYSKRKRSRDSIDGIPRIGSS